MHCFDKLRRMVMLRSVLMSMHRVNGSRHTTNRLEAGGVLEAAYAGQDGFLIDGRCETNGAGREAEL